jgi:hypothetical protein
LQVVNYLTTDNIEISLSGDFCPGLSYMCPILALTALYVFLTVLYWP